MHRAKVLLATAAALVLLAAGCGGDEPGPKPTQRPAPAGGLPTSDVAAVEFPPTATPHPMMTPTPEPTPTPTPTPEPTPIPRVKRQGEMLLEPAARALDSGIQLAALGRHQEALGKFQEAIRIQGRTSWLLEVHAGRTQAGLDRHPEAVEHLNEAIRIRDGADLRARRALSLREAGQCGASIRDAQAALTMPLPESEVPGFSIAAEANRALALCQADRGNMQRALEHARYAIHAAWGAGYLIHELEELADLLRRMEAGQATPVPTQPAEPSPTPNTATPVQEPNPAPGPTPRPAPTVRPTPTPGGEGDPTPPVPAAVEEQLNGVLRMDRVRSNAPDSFRAIREYSWVRDGLTDEETRVLEELTGIFTRDGMMKDAAKLVPMPFMESMDLGEREALRALPEIRLEDPGIFRQIMDGPELTDRMTPIVAVMPAAARNNPELAERMLRQGGTTIETRRIGRRGNREMVLNVIREKGNAGSPGTMNLLEGAVAGIAGFMEEPLPVRSVNLLMADAARPGASGANFGTGIVIPRLEERADTLGWIIAHETAHHYWHGNEPWVDEGMAEFLAAAMEEERLGLRLGTIRYPCSEYSRIADIPARVHAHRCDQSLGSRLFLDMDQEAWRYAFQQEMRKLYLESLEAHSLGGGIGIAEFRERFTASVDHDDQDVHVHGGDALLRWYDGEGEPASNFSPDDSEAAPEMTSLRGRITGFRVMVDGSEEEEFPQEQRVGSVRLRVLYAYEGDEKDEGRTVRLELVVFHEDGIPIVRPPVELVTRSGNIRGHIDITIGPARNPRWAAGEYRAQLHGQDRKLAETGWMVTASRK